MQQLHKLHKFSKSISFYVTKWIGMEGDEIYYLYYEFVVKVISSILNAQNNLIEHIFPSHKITQFQASNTILSKGMDKRKYWSWVAIMTTVK